MNISVIIPSYKPQQYIEDCLLSLKSQSFLAQTFEVIVVLNGPKEPYYQNIIAFCDNEKINNVTVLYSEKSGVSLARNYGIQMAKGKYVTFIDDDDWVSPSYLESLYSKVDTNKLVVSNVIAVDEKQSIVSDYIGDAFTQLNNTTYNAFKYRKFLSSSCCKLIPISMINNIRFDHDFKLGEDSLFMFELSKHIGCIELSDEDCIYYRRVRSASASQRMNKSHIVQRLKLIIKFSQIYLKDITNYNFLIYSSRVVASFIQILKMVTKK